MSIDCRNMTMVVIDSIEKLGVHGFKAAKKFTNCGEPDTSPRVIFFRVCLKTLKEADFAEFSFQARKFSAGVPGHVKEK